MTKNEYSSHTFTIPTYAEYDYLEKKLLAFFNKRQDNSRATLACDLVRHLVLRKSTSYIFPNVWETDDNLTSLIVPLLLWGEESHMTIVCSAYDFDLLSRLHRLGTHLVATLKKTGTLSTMTSPLLIRGQNNYICAARAKKIMLELGITPPASLHYFGERQQFLSIPDNTWRHVCVSGYEPNKCKHCQYSAFCGYFQLRQRISNAHALICSQDLLTHDLLYRGQGHPVLPTGRPMSILSFNSQRLDYSIKKALTRIIRLDQLRSDLQKSKELLSHNQVMANSISKILNSLAQQQKTYSKEFLEELYQCLYTLRILLAHRSNSKAEKKLLLRLNQVCAALSVSLAQENFIIQVHNNMIYIVPNNRLIEATQSFQNRENTVICITEQPSHN